MAPIPVFRCPLCNAAVDRWRVLDALGNEEVTAFGCLHCRTKLRPSRVAHFTVWSPLVFAVILLFWTSADASARLPIALALYFFLAALFDGLAPIFVRLRVAKASTQLATPAPWSGKWFVGLRIVFALVAFLYVVTEVTAAGDVLGPLVAFATLTLWVFYEYGRARCFNAYDRKVREREALQTTRH